ARGIGEADDSELLALAAFHLEPAPRASARIGSVALLGDDAFETVRAGDREEFQAPADLMVAEADALAAGLAEQPAQRLLARLERRRGEAAPIAMQQVKGE